MTPQMALDLATKAVMMALELASPILLVAIVVGVAVNIIQTVTSIKDMTLSFVPKVLASALVLGLAMPWGIQKMTTYFEQTYMLFGMFGNQ